MAINSNPNIKGKKKSSTSATATPSKPWSKRVQAAPKPLSKKKADADEETSAAASAPAPTPTVAAGKKRKSAEDAPVASSSKSPKASKKVAPAAAAASVPASEPILSGYHSTSEDDEEADSSDDDDDDSDVEVDTNPVDVGSLPTVAKDDASVARKLARAKKVAGTEKGVLYLGRVPHGFYEKQMKSYFEQFGDVEKVRLARNKKTGKSKHYAFILMSSLSVAKIVAETMDNYLLLGHILRCKIIPNEEVHASLWVGANRTWRKVPSVRLERAKLEQPRNRSQQQKAEAKLLKRQEAKQAKLKELGIEYDIGKAAYSAPTSA